MEIFELLPLPSDLNSVLRTSKRFHDLAIRAIHRHVIWKLPQQVSRNLPVWDVHKGMDYAAQTLELGVSALPPALPGNIVDIRGDSSWRYESHRTSANDKQLLSSINFHRMERQSYASVDLSNAMFSRIRSFTNLKILTFNNLLFSNAHFAIIHALPQLRALRVEYCIVPPRDMNETYNHRTLPITDLALLNLRRRVADHFGAASIEGDSISLLTLSLASNLRTLRVDSTADVFKYVFHGWQAEAQDHTIPAHLERLYVQRKQLIHSAIAGESSFPDTTFYSFLTRATSLTTYATYHSTPSHQQLQPGALPQLRCYSGPVESVPGILPNRPIEALQLLRCTHGQTGALNHRDGISALTLVGKSFPDLQMLAIEFSSWDDEIMHAICQLFSKIRRLKIVFEAGGPSESTMVDMGPGFLSRLPNLRTFQLYTQPTADNPKPDHPPWLFDSSFTSIEEELRDLIIPWNRWCPALREVQLLSGYTMRRGYTGGDWNMLRIRRLDELEEFEY